MATALDSEKPTRGSLVVNQGGNFSHALSRWLLLWGTSLALAIGLLFYLEIEQRRMMQIDRAANENLLSPNAPKIDREFLRLRQEVLELIQEEVSPNLTSLQQRSAQLSQSISILQADPATADMLKAPGLALTLERVQSLQSRIQRWASNTNREPKDLNGLVTIADALLPEVITVARTASTVQNQRWDALHLQLAANNTWILLTSVIASALLVLTLSTLLLQSRQRAQDQERSRKLTEYFRETQIKAESASRGKSRFLANMSHELRTPFNGILGMLSLLGTTSLSDQQSDYLNTANSSANHLLNVLNDILDLSALEEGKISLQLAPVEIGTLMREISDVMRPQAEQKHLRYSLQISQDVPPWLLMDAKRLKQILFNLANNAVKFTSEGMIQLRVHARGSDIKGEKNAAMLVFEVQDSGIGIHSSALDNLFQRFNQVHHGLGNDYGGTGLGLEISQSLARLMGGEIKVRSTQGAGSCFTLTLEAVICKPPEIILERKLFQVDPPTKPQHVYRILVVEDNQVNRKFVDILLKRMGYLTSFAENGQLALERVQNETFDLVLMDLHMPVMNGVDATRAIRGLSHPASKLPIIALTADVMSDTHDEAIASGVSDFVTKPVHMSRLQEAILKQLEPRKSEAPLATV